MIKHTVLSCTLIILLVGSLLYCISPGEVQTAWSTARERISRRTSEMLESLLPAGTHLVDQARTEPAAPSATTDITPRRFIPFGPRETSDASRLLSWLKGPQLLPLWLSMAALVMAVGYAGRRHFKFVIRRRMAITLAKAVRQDAMCSRRT